MKTALCLLIIISALTSVLITRSAVADGCGSMEDARTAYYKDGNYVKALLILKCLKKEHPDDLDVRRLFSDILYWTGVREMARSEAEDALDLIDRDPDSDPFDERRLHFIDRLYRLKIDGDLSLNSSDTSTGTDGSLQTDYRYSESGDVLLGAYHTSRLYSGDVAIADWHYSVGHVWLLDPKFYVENSFEYSPTAIISAKWGTGITPHFVLKDGSDASIEFRVNSYTTDNVYQISPAWTKPLTEDWTLGLQFYSLFTYHWIFAGQEFLEHQFSPRVSSRFTFADGKAVEGPGLEDDFRSASISVGYKIQPNLAVVPNAGIYRAELRNENYIGIGFELKL